MFGVLFPEAKYLGDTFWSVHRIVVEHVFAGLFVDAFSVDGRSQSDTMFRRHPTDGTVGHTILFGEEVSPFSGIATLDSLYNVSWCPLRGNEASVCFMGTGHRAVLFAIPIDVRNIRLEQGSANGARNGHKLVAFIATDQTAEPRKTMLPESRCNEFTGKGLFAELALAREDTTIGANDVAKM